MAEVKNRRSSTKDGAQERLKCGTIQKEVNYNLPMMSAGVERRIFLLFYPA